MTRTTARRLVTAGIFLIAGQTAFGRQENPQGPPMRGPAQERVEQWKKIRMMEVLKLDDETSIRFFNLYNRAQQELRDIQRKREESIRQLESLIRANATEREIEKSIQDVQGFEGKAVESRDNFHKGARSILTLKQFASYIVFENNFNRSLRELMRDMPQQRMQQRRQF